MTLNKSDKVGMVLMDLSKAYDCIPHDPLRAKLEAYGFCLVSLNLVYSYLTNSLQRFKVNSIYSNWQQVKSGVPQGSVLDNTICTSDDSIDSILRSLKGDINNALKWFKYKQLVANPDKFQVIFMGLEEGQN